MLHRAGENDTDEKLKRRVHSGESTIKHYGLVIYRKMADFVVS
jgi:hypothetical protein